MFLSGEEAVLARSVLAIVCLLLVNAALGAAVTLAVALVILIAVQCKWMVWEAEARNNAERVEFEAVNRGEKEPDPNFLERVWNA